MDRIHGTILLIRRELNETDLLGERSYTEENLGKQVMAEVEAFAALLDKTVGNTGIVHQGPNQTLPNGWVSEYLVHLYRPCPTIDKIQGCKIRVPSGEIFESVGGIYHVSSNKITRLSGEVLTGFYSGEHGSCVVDLEADLQKKIKKASDAECRSLGYRRAAVKDIASGVVEELMNRDPQSWVWDIVHESILKNAEAYASPRRTPYVWMVQERLDVPTGDPWFSPIADGDLVREVIPAMDQEDSGRQWLVLAQPLLESLRLPCPEFETLRPLRESELFYSERGLYYLTKDGLVELGEIATDLLHEHHGQTIQDAEQLVRDEVIRFLVQRIEHESSVSADQYAAAVDAAHEIAAGTNPLELWYRDLDNLAEELRKTLKKRTFRGV